MAQQLTHATQGTSLADLLERVLDKGIVIVGDIKVKLVDVELLTIQVRLMIASVDKARELGLDWWTRNPEFSSLGQQKQSGEMEDIKVRVAALESGVRKDPQGV